MKILQILPELNVGGVERGTVDLAKYLVSHGHQAVVVSNGGKLVAELEKSGVKHYTLPVHKKSIWTAVKMVKELRLIIQKENIDIVHARSRVPAWIAYFACRKTNATFMTTCHGYYNSRAFSQIMGWGKLVIVPSKVIGKHMIETYKVRSENIRCIPRSVDLDKFNTQKEMKEGQSQYIVTMLGRMTQLKGHTYFIQAMAKVIRTMPYVKVWIIGDAPAKKESYRQELEMLTSRLGLREHIEFLGNRVDVAELLAKSDVLVFPSVVPEAFGRAILEAQAVGIPVVASNIGGVIDIIDDGKTGLLVMPKDSDAIAEAVMRLIRDRALVQRLVQAAREKLKNNFTLEHMASKTLAVYEEVLQAVNILVIKISALGDVILITASLQALRSKFPKAKIYCLVGKESRKALQNCPLIDGVIVYDHKDQEKGWMGVLKLARRLREYRFDKVIDFQNSRKSHVLAFLSWARESYGYDNGKWGRLLTHRIKLPKEEMTAVPHQFQILQMLGVSYHDNVKLALWPSDKDRLYVQELLDSEWLGNAQHIVGINIAASAKWQTKNWPIEHVAKLCDVLAAKNIRVVVTGMKKDLELGQKLLSHAKSKPAIVIGKTDILQLAALIERCQVFVSPDSAPLHVAAAVNTPVIALFGPTDSKRHSPPTKNLFVIEKKLTCAPCYSAHCRILTHACLRDISVEEVAKAIEYFIKARKES